MERRNKHLVFILTTVIATQNNSPSLCDICGVQDKKLLNFAWKKKGVTFQFLVIRMTLSTNYKNKKCERTKDQDVRHIWGYACRLSVCLWFGEKRSSCCATIHEHFTFRCCLAAARHTLHPSTSHHHPNQSGVCGTKGSRFLKHVWSKRHSFPNWNANFDPLLLRRYIAFLKSHRTYVYLENY